MTSKIKRIFFNGMFGILYAVFVYLCATAIYGAVTGKSEFELAFLPFLWLALIASRYLSRKSAGIGKPHNGGGHGGGFRKQ